MANITFKGNPVTLVGDKVSVNQKAPDFTLVDKELTEKKLSDFKGKIKILSIFPSIDTSTCATQVRTFNKKATELAEDVVVICISKDLPFAQSKFCAAEGIDRVVMLSDYKENNFGAKYGFLVKELGLLTRGIVVVDKNDNIVYIEYVPEIADEPNYDKAIGVVNDVIKLDKGTLLNVLQSKCNFTQEQAASAQETVKDFLKDKLPNLISDRLDDILVGKKIDFQEIIKEEATAKLNEFASTAGEFAGKMETTLGETFEKYFGNKNK